MKKKEGSGSEEQTESILEGKGRRRRMRLFSNFFAMMLFRRKKLFSEVDMLFCLGGRIDVFIGILSRIRTKLRD